MNTKRIIKTFLILLVVIINIGCDQVSKKIVRKHVNPHETILILNDHVMITNVENSGAFLSAGDSLPKAIKNVLLSILPLIAIALGFVYVLAKQTIPKPMLLGFCFILGGGIGNIFDRIMYGSVTDFLYINIGFFKTGIFNLADLSILFGVAIILFQSFLKRSWTKV